MTTKTTKTAETGTAKRTSKRSGEKAKRAPAPPVPVADASAAPPPAPAPPEKEPAAVAPPVVAAPPAEEPAVEEETPAGTDVGQDGATHAEPVQADGEPAKTSGGADAAETSGDPEPGKVAPPVAEAPSCDPAPDAGETSGGEAPPPAQPSAESAEVPAVTVAQAPTKKGKKGKAPKAAPPPAPAPVQPAVSGPVPAWRSSPARILRSALSPLDDRWYDWSKLEATIPGVLAARTLLRAAYETATRLEKAAASGKPAARKVEPGAAVRVRAKHAPGYAPLADVTGILRVTGVAGGQAKVETARGEAVLLPVAHLELAEAAA